jgi:hypothetical protein
MMDYKVIQDWHAKAIAGGTNVVLWSDLLEALEKYRNRDTTDYTSVHPVKFTSLPEYDDEAAAATGGLTEGTLYRTTTGEIRVKLPDP